MKTTVISFRFFSAIAAIIIALGMAAGCDNPGMFDNSEQSPESLIRLELPLPLDPNHQTGTVAFDGAMTSSGAMYKACEPMSLALLADKGPLTASEDVTSSLYCDGNCEFYSDSACTAPIRGATIPAGSSASAQFYVRPVAAKLSLSTPGEQPYYAGSSIADIRVNVTYDFIDAQYVWSVNDMGAIGYDIVADDIRPGDVWIFLTKNNYASGYRGKIRIEATAMSTVDPGGLAYDTLNFSVVIWYPDAPHLQKYAGTDTITASDVVTDKCYMDFSMTPVVVNGMMESLDLWWGISPEGNVVFQPLNGTVFRRLPRAGE